MIPFAYTSASSISEVLSHAEDSQAYILAGGTDLLIKIKNGKIKPSVLIDLKKVPELSGLNLKGERIEIGSLTTIREIEISPLINEKVNILSLAASKLGSVQVRNRATIGGNICNAAPSAETVPALLCLDAIVEIIGIKDVRQIPLKDFFNGPGETSVQGGEILSKIIVDIPPTTARGIYHKLSTRRAMDIAAVGVAVLLDVVEGIIVKARIALGAVAPVPMRVPQAEELLVGNTLTKKLALEAAMIASEACQPISDIRASASYRRDMVRALTEQGLWQTYISMR